MYKRQVHEKAKRRRGFSAQQFFDMLGVAMSMHDASVDWSGERHPPIYMPCSPNEGSPNPTPLQAHSVRWRGTKMMRNRGRPAPKVQNDPNLDPNTTLEPLPCVYVHADTKSHGDVFGEKGRVIEGLASVGSSCKILCDDGSTPSNSRGENSTKSVTFYDEIHDPNPNPNLNHVEN